MFLPLQFNNTRMLRITDFNDNGPVFEQPSYNKTVSEVSHWNLLGRDCMIHFYVVGCLSDALTVENDVCVEFDIGGLFSHSSAVSRKFLWTDFKSSFKDTLEPVCNLYRCEVETWSLHYTTLRMDFTVKEETSCVQQLNLWNEIYFHIYRLRNYAILWILMWLIKF